MSQQEDQAFVTAFKGVIIFLVGLAIAILILAIFISKEESGSERSASYKEALIAPIGKVNTEPGKMVAGGAPAAAPGPALAAQPAAQQVRSGKQIVESVCSTCHAAGVLNAPKIGDKAAWQPRIAQGENVLLQHAIQGFKLMPAKGGNTSLSDEDMKKAVSYMLEQVGAAPAKAEAPAPAAQAPAASPPAPQASAAQAPATAPSAPAPQATSTDKGKQVYTATCFACHGTGVLGSPKLGDKAAWQPRAAQGMGVLVQHATQGFKAMPAKGGNPSMTEDDLKSAITYMLEQAGVKAQ